MNIFRKIGRKVLQLASTVVVPKRGRLLKHVSGPDCELLVFANEDVGRQIWLFGSFEPDETAFFRDFIKPDDICMDVGGNVGFFSVLMGLSASSGTVHVFEPIPLNASLVRVNCDLNALTNVRVNNVAVGASEGAVKFSVSVDSAYSSIHATGRSAQERVIDVPVVTLDEYVSRLGIPRVDIMKVDVEGAEDMVVSGALQLLSNSAVRPRMVLLELLDRNLQPFGTSVEAVMRRMEALGYRAHVLANGGGSLIPYSPGMANRRENIIFLPT